MEHYPPTGRCCGSVNTRGNFRTYLAEPTATPPTAKGTTAGGGPGQVGANMATKVYHCPGNKWYGKTKQGEFMSETDAKAKGFKADHGEACS